MSSTLFIADITNDNTIDGIESQSPILFEGTATPNKDIFLYWEVSESKDIGIELTTTSDAGGAWQVSLDPSTIRDEVLNVLEDSYYRLFAIYQDDVSKIDTDAAFEMAQKTFALNTDNSVIDVTDADILAGMLLDSDISDGHVEQALNSRFSTNIGQGVTVNFSFATQTSRDDFSAFTDAGKAAARRALQVYEDTIGGLTFNEVDSNGDIQFAMMSSSTLSNGATEHGNFFPYAWEQDSAYQPHTFGGTINISRDKGEGQWADGQYGYFLLMHEIGHALGLDHPFSDSYSDSNKVPLPEFFAHSDYTIMAGERVDLGEFDIKALEYIYGTTANSATVNAVETELETEPETGTGSSGGNEETGNDVADNSGGIDQVNDGDDYESSGFVKSSKKPVIKLHNAAKSLVTDGIPIKQYSANHSHTHQTAESSFNPFSSVDEEFELEVDVDTSGAVGIADVIAQLRHIVGLDSLSGIGASNADVDQDGAIGISDVIGSLRTIVGLNASPKAHLVDSNGNRKFTEASLPDEFFVTVIGDVDGSWSPSSLEGTLTETVPGIDSGTDTEVDPGTGTEVGPGTDAEVSPGTGTEVNPGTDTEVDPGTGTEVDPGTDTEVSPGTGTEVDPGTDTEVDPGNGTETDPGTDPGVGPGTDTGGNPGADTDTNPGASPSPIETSGKVSLLIDSKLNYWIQSEDLGEPIKMQNLAGADAVKGELDGFNVVGVETINDRYYFALQNEGDQSYKFWSFDSEWGESHDETVDSATLSAIETIFKQDLNGSGYVAQGDQVIIDIHQGVLGAFNAQHEGLELKGDSGDILYGLDVIANAGLANTTDAIYGLDFDVTIKNPGLNLLPLLETGEYLTEISYLTTTVNTTVFDLINIDGSITHANFGSFTAAFLPWNPHEAASMDTLDTSYSTEIGLSAARKVSSVLFRPTEDMSGLELTVENIVVNLSPQLEVAGNIELVNLTLDIV